MTEVTVLRSVDTHDKTDSPFSLLARLQRDRAAFLNEERSLTLRMKARLRWIAAQDCPDHKASCKRCNEIAAAWHSGKGEAVNVAMARELNAPFLLAQEPITAIRAAVEKEMISVARTLAVAPFVEETRGLG